MAAVVAAVFIGVHRFVEEKRRCNNDNGRQKDT